MYLTHYSVSKNYSVGAFPSGLGSVGLAAIIAMLKSKSGYTRETFIHIYVNWFAESHCNITGAECQKMKRKFQTDLNSCPDNAHTDEFTECMDTRSNIFRQWTIGGKVPWAPVLHWAVIYHGITGYLPTNEVLRNLYNPTCTYTLLQNQLVDQLVSVAQQGSTLAFLGTRVRIPLKSHFN